MTGPVGGLGPRPPERTGAVARVGPASPASAAPALDAALRDALARTGLDLSQLLAGGADALVARPAVDEVALAEVLERARGALVRSAPQELLEVLDREWVGAARSAAGWYYRGAALALLGLPGEADRVLADGRALHDAPALAFARSVVRLAVADLPGARAALADAFASLERSAPMEGGARSETTVDRVSAIRLLQAWEALLLARRGSRAEADARLAQWMAEDDDAGGLLAWLQRALARARVDAMRADGARTSEAPPVTDEATAGDAPAPAGPDDRRAPGRVAVLDAVDGALRRLGGQLRGAGVGPAAGDAALVSEVLLTLQALATGGALWDAARPARVHAARSVLAVALQVLLEPAAFTAPGPDGAPSSATRDVLRALLADAVPDARALLSRVAATEGAEVAEVLARLLDDRAGEGAGGARAAGPTATGTAPEREADAAIPTPRVQQAVTMRADDLLATPLRLGLVLVPVPMAGVRSVHRGRRPDGIVLDGTLGGGAARTRTGGARVEAPAPHTRSRASRPRWLVLVVLLLAAWWWLSR